MVFFPGNGLFFFLRELLVDYFGYLKEPEKYLFMLWMS